MERMQQHAERFQTRVVHDHIHAVDFSKKPFSLQGNETFTAMP